MALPSEQSEIGDSKSEMTALAKRETRAIRALRVAVLALLIMTATVVCLGVYF